VRKPLTENATSEHCRRLFGRQSSAPIFRTVRALRDRDRDGDVMRRTANRVRRRVRSSRLGANPGRAGTYVRCGTSQIRSSDARYAHMICKCSISLSEKMFFHLVERLPNRRSIGWNKYPRALGTAPSFNVLYRYEHSHGFILARQREQPAVYSVYLLLTG
jgi:hypothetical protein